MKGLLCLDYYLNEEGGAGEERRKNKKSHISKFYINKSNNKMDIKLEIFELDKTSAMV
jgi:hypothetical protein